MNETISDLSDSRETPGDHPPEDPVRAAQQRLAAACMAQPMTPQGVSISGFVNGALARCALDALIEYAVKDKDRYAALLVEHTLAKAELLETTARTASRLIVPGGHA